MSESKHTKAEVDYGKGMASAHCGICAHYLPSRSGNRCQVVQGAIDPDDWCYLFRKEAA